MNFLMPEEDLTQFSLSEISNSLSSQQNMSCFSQEIVNGDLNGYSNNYIVDYLTSENSLLSSYSAARLIDEPMVDQRQLTKTSSLETTDTSYTTISQKPSDYVCDLLDDIYCTSSSYNSCNVSVNMDTEQPICYDFVQGRCKRLNCKYQHCIEAIVKHNSNEKRICFDYLRGECPRGNLCRFSHDVLTLVNNWLAECPNVVACSTSRGICYDFCKGSCKRGTKCQWTHHPIEIAWLTAKNKPLTPYMKSQIESKVIEVIYNEQLQKELCTTFNSFSSSPFSMNESVNDRQILTAIEELKMLDLNNNMKSPCDTMTTLTGASTTFPPYL